MSDYISILLFFFYANDAIFLCTVLLTNLLIMFNSSVIVFFQGRNGQTGLPGPVGPKGNQVNI